MKKLLSKIKVKKKLKYIIPVGMAVGLFVVGVIVLRPQQSSQFASTESSNGTSGQSSLTVTSNPNQSTISIEQINQQKLIFGYMTVDNLFENINLRRNHKGLGTLTSNANLSKAAESIIGNQANGTDNSKFSQLMKNSGYKYALVSSSILTSCNDLTCALSSLEYSDTDKGIYSSAFKDIGIAVSSNQNYAVIVWGQPYQQVATNYSSGSTSSSSGSGSTFVLPDWSYKYTPPPDIDYSRPSPTLDSGSTTPTNTCTSVTSSEPNKYYYKCGYGQKATGVNCKAIAPYDYTSNLWSCNK